ncbi:SulP family inorganic anion transporter [Wenzhouxiangella sp. AB-CW3]|uniref:SulP family inorganic anion transporter n=1 Tax=Wenzhouxiangella sp. AB-CW3 TaxID=2771012 RepID=UPI00168A8536|nr:SulP family inorganic anion transporter [Wenzhouxiangella sp. AB-CW3]QOC21816.1 SulP family inorganic anion transporter [Wenzhouxiangella sp. AB-CW3]
MSFLYSVRRDWFSNVRADVLAGLVVALALIPEAIAFSLIAGVDPKVGLYASFCIAVVISFTGGRPGMISAATGAMALLMVTLVRDHGLEYLLAATLLTGVLQIIAGYFKVAELMRFVSRSVVTGFVNALAILIFLAQIPELINVPAAVYPMVVAGLVIIYGLPRLTRAIPSPLIAIVFLTLAAVAFGIQVPTVGDKGDLPDALPTFLLPDIPWTLETLWIILPVSLTLTVVGLLESFLTAQIVDDLTDTSSDKHREAKGQGVANIVSGFFGGMAGCAMIGQSVINVKSGGRGRLSSLVAGVFLLLMVVFLSDYVGMIPMAALVAVMIMVSIGTFSWRSIIDLKHHPKTSSLVMIGTVVVTVATHDLAKGVLTGVLLSALGFARKVSQVLVVEKSLEDDGETRRYTVTGQVFFASASDFLAAFDFREVIERVRIDVSSAHFWDLSAVGALDRVILKFRREGVEIDLVGMNEASRTMVDRLGVHDKPDAEKLLGH